MAINYVASQEVKTVKDRTIEDKTEYLRQLFRNHFEWVAFAAGLLVMGLMNPYAENGTSWCLFDLLGFSFCPGEGLGHSIAFIFRGDMAHAMEANVLGPLAVVVLSGRVIYLLRERMLKANQNSDLL